MTEYEAYDALMSLSAQTYTLMFGYFSLVSAFLVMSHMLDAKLTYPLAAVVVGLYSLASLIIVLNFYALNSDLDNLYAHMLQKRLNGEWALVWFGKNPLWVPKLLSLGQVFLGLGGYFGSLYFFLVSQRSVSVNGD